MQQACYKGCDLRDATASEPRGFVLLPLLQVTHAGLNAMLQRQLQEARLRMQDPLALVNVSNPR
jgi:hypothetical protein